MDDRVYVCAFNVSLDCEFREARGHGSSIAVCTVPGHVACSRSLTWDAKWDLSCFPGMGEKSPQLKTRCLKSPLFDGQSTAALWPAFSCRTFSKGVISAEPTQIALISHTHANRAGGKRGVTVKEPPAGKGRIHFGDHLLPENRWAAILERAP